MKWFLAGIFGLFLAGWLLQVYVPSRGLGKLDPSVDEDTGVVYPVEISAQGRQVYAAGGCAACHTQQVHVPGPDLARRWGTRRSVARDYLYQDTPFLGTLRIGPDLASVGARDPAQTGAVDLTAAEAQKKTAAWHYLHLFNPRSVQPLSHMPAFPWLFTQRKIQGERSSEALILQEDFAPPGGFEIVPTADAKALVAYLLSLNQDVSLPESRKVEGKKKP